MNTRKLIMFVLLGTVTGCSMEGVSRELGKVGERFSSELKQVGKPEMSKERQALKMQLERDVNASPHTDMELIMLMHEAKKRALANPTIENIRHYRRLEMRVNEIE